MPCSQFLGQFCHLKHALFGLPKQGPFVIKIAQIVGWPAHFLDPLLRAGQGWFLGICLLL
jgi:hypothetical protein